MYFGIHTSKCRKVKKMKKNFVVIVVVTLLALVLAPAALALEVQDGGGTQIEARTSSGLRVEWQPVQAHERGDNSDPDSILPPGLDPTHVHLWRCEKRYTPSCPPPSEDPIHAHPAGETP
jgi:hypothetical protein